MKTILYALALVGLFSTGCTSTYGQETPASVSSAAAITDQNGAAVTPSGIQLTPQQTAVADNWFNSLLKYIPAKYQGIAVAGILLLSGLGHIGRFASAFKSSPNWLLGIFNGVKSITTGSATTIKMLLLAGLCSFALTGCHTTQINNAESGTGVKIKAVVPIPGMATAGNLIDLSMTAGWWKSATSLQPTGTNGTISAPSVAIIQSTTGKAGANGTAGTSTNAQAGIGASGIDQTAILTGEAALTASNNPAVLSATTQK